MGLAGDLRTYVVTGGALGFGAQPPPADLRPFVTFSGAIGHGAAPVGDPRPDMRRMMVFSYALGPGFRRGPGDLRRHLMLSNSFGLGWAPGVVVPPVPITPPTQGADFVRGTGALIGRPDAIRKLNEEDEVLIFLIEAADDC